MAETRKLRILVTNDDGIYAPGIKILEQIARDLTEDVWVVAPESEQSGASRSLTLAHPIRMRELDGRHFAILGTPADCVLMATRKIMPEPPDLILSGVNGGQNLAEDVTYSGTIAAAMEGTALGYRSMALRLAYRVKRRDLSWEVARQHGPGLVARLHKLELGAGVLLNINFPDCAADEVKGVEVTRQGQRDQNLVRLDERVDMRERTYFWLGFQRERSNPAPGTDLRAVYEGRISVTPLHMNLTQLEVMDSLRAALNK
jgi:5'-nucleotidase